MAVVLQGGLIRHWLGGCCKSSGTSEKELRDTGEADVGKDSPKNLALPSKALATRRVSPCCHYRVYQCPTSKGSKATTALGQ